MGIKMNSLCFECQLRKKLKLARSLGSDEQATAFARTMMQALVNAPEELDSTQFGAMAEDFLRQFYNVGPDRLKEEKELAVYSSEGRVVLFSSSLLAPKSTRSTQGVAVMTLKPKYRLDTVMPVEQTSISNKSRYRMRSVPAAGALLKQEDSEEQQIGLLD